MEAVAMLRQVVGEIQELWELYGSSSRFDHPSQSWCFLDLDNRSMEDGCFNLILGGKSGSVKMEEANKPPPRKRSRGEKSREKTLAALSSTDIVMDQGIWKEFPEDLLETMISRLPIASFFRLRSVCHKWNSLLTSPTFSQHCAEVHRAQHPWFYTMTHKNVNGGAIYDPSLKKWYDRPIPSLPSRTVILPVATARGLVCFLDIGQTNFFVCNPLTSSFKELPPRSIHMWSRVAIGMVETEPFSNSGYKIVWLGCHGDHEVYDSVQNTWTRPGVLPMSVKLPLCLNLTHTVSIGTTIYFMRADPDGILSYDVASGAWKQLIVPLPLHVTDQALAESGGRVLLVGLLTKNAATCVGIWELQRMTLLWKEVDRMPNVWCLEFYGNYVQMTCIGNRGLLMLSLRSRRMNRLVSYDVGKREWGKVCDCILPHSGRRKQWIAYGTAFDPCPTALA